MVGRTGGGVPKFKSEAGKLRLFLHKEKARALRGLFEQVLPVQATLEQYHAFYINQYKALFIRQRKRRRM